MAIPSTLAFARVEETLAGLLALQQDDPGAKDRASSLAALGELLFAAVRLARSLGLDAEQALRETAAAFESDARDELTTAPKLRRS